MERTRCFVIEPTGDVKRWLRRYVRFGASEQERKCSAAGNQGYHQNWIPLDIVAEGQCEQDVPREDSRWPKLCSCGFHFSEADEWQIFTSNVYRRLDTGEKMTLHDAPPGAMWDATWLRDCDGQNGNDGHCLMVRLPNGSDWHIDGRAGNCTMPNDFEHKCWVRHGEAPNITVDKNGKTCAAGSGSILSGNWHGFLRNGYLEA